MRKVWIYTLSDPDTNLVKYIGKTFRIERRLKDHLRCPDNNKKDTWIKSLKNQNKKPILEILDECDECTWKELEIYWISQFKSWGFELKNMTSGGEGTFGIIPWNKGKRGCLIHSEESKQKMSLSRKGKSTGKKSEETKLKISSSKLGKPGHKWNEQQFIRMKGANSPVSKKVYCYTLDMILVKIYDSATATEIDGFCKYSVGKVCLGKNKSHKDFIFQFN